MPTIRVLYLDNDKAKYESMQRQLTVYWKKLFDETLSFDYVSSIEDAIDALNNSTYDLFVADLLFPPMDAPRASATKHVQRGLEAIRVAKPLPGMLTLAITVGAPSLGDLKGAALEAGAHLFRYRSEFTSPTGSGIPGLCQDIRRALLDRRVITDTTPLDYDHDDPRLEYIISEVTEPVIKALYKQLLPADIKPSRITASYLAPGMSGAFVIRVETLSENAPPSSHLLKVSQSRERLQREIDRYPGYAAYSNRLLVRYLSVRATPAENNGWFAIAAPFEKDARTLGEWLLRVKPPKATVEAVMHSLFLENGLTNGYGKDLRPDTDAKRATEVLTSSVSRQARIVETLNDLGGAARDRTLAGDPDWEGRDKRLRRFVRSGQVGSISKEETPARTYMCLSHGDLHSRNILVTGTVQPTPIVIDTSEFDTHHWASDYVRLLADLLFGVMDSDTRLHYWTKLPAWIEAAKRAALCEPIPSDLVNEDYAVAVAVNWLTSHVREACPAYSGAEGGIPRRWEFLAALAFEFLRVAYRSDLTAPKRTSALIAADDVLVLAEQALSSAMK